MTLASENKSSLGKTCPVPLCRWQILHGWVQTWVSLVTGWQLRAQVQPMRLLPIRSVYICCASCQSHQQYCKECTPGGSVWVWYVDETGSRCVFTGGILPKHNWATHIQQELDIHLCLHYHVVCHRVWQRTQVIEPSIVHHTAVRGVVRWTRSSCVPHIIKIAVHIL